MKISITAATIAGALLVSNSVYAADPVSLVAKSSLMETGTAAADEMNRAMGGQRDAVKRMEIYAKHEFSPALRPKLKAVFGNERPFPVVRSAGPKGQVIYTSKLMPHAYLDENGTAFSWSELNSRSVANKAGTALDTKMSMPSLSVVGTATAAMLENLSGDFKETRGPGGIWYGDFKAKLGSLVIREADAGGVDLKERVRFEDLACYTGINRRGTKVDVVYGSSIQSIRFGGERVDRANLAIRVVNLPAQAMADVEKELDKVQHSGLPDDAQMLVMTKSMLGFAKSLLIKGVSIMVDDISASYRGNTASIKGRIDFDKLVQADLTSPTEFANKIIARLDVRVPVAMVNDVSRAVAIRQVDASAPNAAEQVETAAKNMAAVVLGKLVNEGFVLVDKGELRSTFELKNGKVTFNGKSAAVPGVPAPAAAAPAP
ncbi:DUF945 family protein [Duganella sp. HH105]|uniref:DUF945 family protein n=1 Tax=Duganella sp. HH105 TaxID=1781067 RepID=UPI000877B57B|nr:DUF945 family protein [Duganella sp. HH105]OEZ60392.1 hypothetical protein DUGA6_31220 [Duganella sp. HH105]